MAPLRILVAPSGFKESLGPEDAAACIEQGIRRVAGPSEAFVCKMPVHDGGEGFCRAVVSAHRGRLVHADVTGPVRQPVASHYGIIGDTTAVLDMAAAAGLRLVPRDGRDPTRTTSYGVGQLMKLALDQGCSKIIVGCGDSGTTDAGAGEVVIEAVCNTSNLLCGDRGVARVYGPQKGATPAQVELLSQAMDSFSRAASLSLGRDISQAPGSGASGGLGAGLLVLGASLRGRTAAIDEYFGLGKVLAQPWDLVFTAEGSLDAQSAAGKMTSEVARRATTATRKRTSGGGGGGRARGTTQVVALAGSIGDGAERMYGTGVSAYASILDGPLTLEDAMARTGELLTGAAERTMRMVLVGAALGARADLGRVATAPICQVGMPSAAAASSSVVAVTQMSA
ncbi:hypothetical protein PLICBS_003135 [Purpureocillium lilacinum]|uniref:uncharacterized protein n=1 Tax=Purpureocillium lilacinum TaxID=33203 RepID=UPI0020872A17|nr:hypothetical protein PLICBS_003135 [Purpureocillium lilacinum]